MKKLIAKRVFIVLMQALFVVQLATKIDLQELSDYYLTLSIASIVALTLYSYPEYYILENIKTTQIKRGSLLFPSSILLLIAAVTASLAQFLESLVFFQLSALTLLSITSIYRNHYNILGCKQKVLNTQIYEIIIKLIAFEIIDYIAKAESKDVVLSQWIAAITLIFYFFTLDWRKKRRTQPTPLPKPVVHDLIKITSSAFINTLYINALKIVLGVSADTESIAKVGIAQQISGTVVQSINAVLQIQFGAQMLRGGRYLGIAVLPTLKFLLSVLVILTVLYISGSSILPYNIQNVGLTVFVLVYVAEAYIIPLSYLVRYFAGVRKSKSILMIHSWMIIFLTQSCLFYALSGDLRYFLVSSCALTGLYFWIFMKRAANV